LLSKRCHLCGESAFLIDTHFLDLCSASAADHDHEYSALRIDRCDDYQYQTADGTSIRDYIDVTDIVPGNSTARKSSMVQKAELANPPLRVRLSDLTGDSDALRRALAVLPDASDSEIAFSLDDPNPQVILYLEAGYTGLAHLPTLVHSMASFPQARHFMFSESDWPFPMLPGRYCSLTRSYPWATSWSYLLRPSSFDIEQPPNIKYLFSFLGRASTHPIRSSVLRLDSDMSPCLDVSSAAARFPDYDYRKTYDELLRDSRFILCPRGIGASSMRIFEAMRAGRVPVIISDDWLPPPGPPWEDISVRIMEKEVSTIPRILSRISNPIEMGVQNRRFYDQCFSPELFLKSLVTSILSGRESSDSICALLYRALRSVSLREIRSLIRLRR
jgi:hypothetical protein